MGTVSGNDYTAAVESHISAILAAANRNQRPALKSLDTPDGLLLPAIVDARLRRNAPAVDFTQSSSMVGLKGDLLLLRLYGHWDRAFPAAQHVASVPWMNWGQFEVLRMIVHDVRWAAAREGDMNSVAKLGEHAFDDDYRPLFMDKEGLPFKRPLDDPKLRRSLGLDPSPGSFILPPPNRITPFLNDLSLLAMIWAYGGSPVWPMDRLEHERARLEAGLLALPGMSP